MSRDEALRRLRANEAHLRARKIDAMYLFGSTARDEAKIDSDVDVLIRFTENARVDLFDLSIIQFDMSDLLSTEVHVATIHSGNSDFVSHLKRDLIQIF